MMKKKREFHHKVIDSVTQKRRLEDKETQLSTVKGQSHLPEDDNVDLEVGSIFHLIWNNLECLLCEQVRKRRFYSESRRFIKCHRHFCVQQKHLESANLCQSL